MEAAAYLRSSVPISYFLLPISALEHSFGGPLGILIAGLGLGAFYAALLWVNSLLGLFLTPLFIMPLTWIQDAMAARKAERSAESAATTAN